MPHTNLGKLHPQMHLAKYIKQRSDRLMNYFLASFFICGLLLAPFYNTWLFAVITGSSCLLAYYGVRAALPESDLYQYVLSGVLGVFMAQFIFETHGMFEMHFVAFIASAILITYQNWKLQVPLMLFVLIHHAVLGYFQNTGISGIYLTESGVVEAPAFIIHITLAATIFFICGLWANQLKRYSIVQLEQLRQVTSLEREAQENKHRVLNEAILKEAFQKAEIAREEADEANKAKSVFLATMSHEIRTPMNGVIGMASLLSETQLTEEQQEYAKTISTCGEALLTVINDILDFSKIESGKMELELRDFDLRTCIEEVLDIFAGRAGRQGIDMVYEIDHDVPAQIVGDSFRLRQILVNLVSNAIKFTEQGEIFIGVHLHKTVVEKELALQFEVRDTGIGITGEKIEKLFKAFSQVDSSTTRKYGGTGLGLTICEKLVNLMGGQIAVKSQEQEGTVFTFTILCKASSQSVRTYVTSHVSGMQGKRVLVVDDNFTNLSILKNQLEIWKAIPTLAGSGKVVLEILAAGKSFDLVLTDMQMPDMDGCELAVQIQQLYPTLPIILLSSLGDERNKMYTGLFKAILTKPIKQEMLCRLLVNELRGKTNGLAEQPKPITQTLSAGFAQGHPLKILVAEDNLVNQKLTLKILSKLGFEPTLAVNGSDTVELALLHTYDIILMDVQMPEMDGIEATRIIRQNIEVQPVIIAMTANAMKEDKDNCLAAGMDDFLSKPVKLEDVVEMLAKWSNNIQDKKRNEKRA